MSNTNIHDLPLPYGWVKEIHQESGHPYYVDTKANPPRSIWCHPYEDEQYLHEHPEAREKVRPPPGPGPGHAPSYTHDQGHHSRTHSYQAAPQKKGKRGFLGKLKDKAIGTKEEREQVRQAQIMAQEQRRQQLAAQRAQFGQPQYGGGAYGGGPYNQYGGGAYNQYGPPPMSGFPGGQQRMGGMGGMGGGRMGGGGMALPLLGGMAGGLLLGEALSDGGGFDGGGFDGGGDFGGGFD
ncbi:hypothetical protein V5O48_003382 [Marasmius crinis-equi]|uniref:WW domain-containing protein n=1 Tax=Marasmius crinis-equi TaxID=585013 RepID=A0ABR3FSY5_9AGAR